MEAYKDIKPNQTEAEIAYKVLKRRGEPIRFRELMENVSLIRKVPLDNPQLMATIHTQINLDSRFVFLGQGNWGLKEWTQSKTVRRHVHPTAPGHSGTVRRRSLQDEMETEDKEYDNFNPTAADDENEDEWEE